MTGGHPTRVLVAGAGVAALEAALALHALAEERVAVELVAPETEFSYRPLAVAEPFRVGEVRRFPLLALARAAGAELRQGSFLRVDAERKVVVTEKGEELDYDVLLLALGGRPRGLLAARRGTHRPGSQARLCYARRGDVAPAALRASPPDGHSSRHSRRRRGLARDRDARDTALGAVRAGGQRGDRRAPRDPLHRRPARKHPGCF